MITDLTITDATKIPIGWWARNEALCKMTEWKFQPGINILWGKNGAGKSSLLKLLAYLFHAEQGGFFTITQWSLDNMFPYNGCYYDGVKVSHDGQGIFCVDPSKKVGSFGGMFDDDFFDEGLASIFTKGSAGQLTVHQLVTALKKTKKEGRFEPEYRMTKKSVNDIWGKRIERVEEFFKPNIETTDTITVLLDEPDRSLDIPMQAKVWKALCSGKKTQFIVASHSLFAIDIPGANYIELTPGYLDECRAALNTARKESTNESSS